MSWKLWLLFPVPKDPESCSRAFSQREGRSPAVTPSVLAWLWPPSPTSPNGARSPSSGLPTATSAGPQHPEPPYLGPLIRLPNSQPQLLSQLLTELGDALILGRQTQVEQVRPPGSPRWAATPGAACKGAAGSPRCGQGASPGRGHRLPAHG